MDSVRERIIQAITAKVAGLSVLPVTRCERSRPAEVYPFISVWDGPGSLLASAFGIDTRQFQIGVEAAWIAQAGASLEANAMLADIERAVLAGDRSLGGLCLKLAWQAARPGYPEDGSQVVSAFVTFAADYATPAGDPYTVATLD